MINYNVWYLSLWVHLIWEKLHLWTWVSIFLPRFGRFPATLLLVLWPAFPSLCLPGTDSLLDGVAYACMMSLVFFSLCSYLWMASSYLPSNTHPYPCLINSVVEIFNCVIVFFRSRYQTRFLVSIPWLYFSLCFCVVLFNFLLLSRPSQDFGLLRSGYISWWGWSQLHKQVCSPAWHTGIHWSSQSLAVQNHLQGHDWEDQSWVMGLFGICGQPMGIMGTRDCR